MRKIILLVGASGAGKDTLLKEARIHFKNDPKIHVIKRYITRQPGKFEENYYVDDQAFEILRNNRFFFTFWYAHHLKYGIPEHAIAQLKEDEVAIISVSREKISDFESRFGHKVVVIHVTADRKVIEERLKRRKRENRLQIETRLQRMEIPVVANNLVHFDNNRELTISAKAFISLLENIIQNKK